MCLQKICGLINRLILLVNVDGLPTIKHTYKRGEVMTKKTLSVTQEPCLSGSSPTPARPGRWWRGRDSEQVQTAPGWEKSNHMFKLICLKSSDAPRECINHFIWRKLNHTIILTIYAHSCYFTNDFMIITVLFSLEYAVGLEGPVISMYHLIKLHPE